MNIQRAGSDVCLLRVIWFYKQNEAFLTFI